MHQLIAFDLLDSEKKNFEVWQIFIEETYEGQVCVWTSKLTLAYTLFQTSIFCPKIQL